MAPKAEPTGGGGAAIASPGEEMTAVVMEEEINIGEDNPEVRTVTGIPDNHGVSSSSEPSTVGVDVVTTSAVSAAV